MTLTTEPKVESTVERMVTAGKRLFAERGFEGTSVKDISDAAGTNVSAISYHFGGKEGLYRRIIESAAERQLSSAQRILVPPQSKEEIGIRLQIFAEQTLETWISDPEPIIIIQREVEMQLPRVMDIFQKTMQAHFIAVVEFLTHSKENGFLDSKIDPEMAAAFFMGQILHHFRLDPLAKKLRGRTLRDEDYRNFWMDQFIVLFLKGILS